MDKSEPIKMKNISRNPVGKFHLLLQSNQNRGEQETELHDGCQLGIAWRGFCEILKSSDSPCLTCILYTSILTFTCFSYFTRISQ